MIVKKYSNVKRRFYLSKKDRKKFKGEVIIFRSGNFIYFLTPEEWKRVLNKKLAGLKGKIFSMKKRYLCSSVFIGKISKTIFIPLKLRRKEEK